MSHQSYQADLLNTPVLMSPMGKWRSWNGVGSPGLAQAPELADG